MCDLRVLSRPIAWKPCDGTTPISILSHLCHMATSRIIHIIDPDAKNVYNPFIYEMCRKGLQLEPSVLILSVAIVQYVLNVHMCPSEQLNMELTILACVSVACKYILDGFYVVDIITNVSDTYGIKELANAERCVFGTILNVYPRDSITPFRNAILNMSTEIDHVPLSQQTIIPSSHSSNARVLIVDDDLFTVHAHTIMVEEFTRNITSCCTLSDAKEIIQEKQFDVMLIDLELIRSASATPTNLKNVMQRDNGICFSEYVDEVHNTFASVFMKSRSIFVMVSSYAHEFIRYAHDNSILKADGSVGIIDVIVQKPLNMKILDVVFNVV